MKKLLSIVVVLALALSVLLTACGPKESSAPVEDATKVLLVVSALGDKSFNDSAWEGLTKAKADLGVDAQVLEFGDDNSKVESTLADSSDGTYDVVCFNNLGFGMAVDWLDAHSAEYPDVTYLVYDPDHNLENKNANVQFLLFKQAESEFLAASMAMKMSETKKIGFVGGMNIPVIQDFLLGYVEGAVYTDPNAKIAISFTEGWTDAAKGKELGLAAIDKGADFVAACAGGSGNGALEAAMERGVWGIGVDADQAMLFKDAKPDLAKTIITSAIKHVGVGLHDILSQMKDGTFVAGGKSIYNAANGGCGIAKNEYYEANVPQDVKDYLADLEAKIIAGDIEIGTAYGMETAAFDAIVKKVKI